MGLLSLLFPNCCSICATELVRGEQTICVACEMELPFTKWWQTPTSNPLYINLRSRQFIAAAFSIFHFHAESRSRQLMHFVKYEKSPLHARRIGEKISSWSGNEAFNSIDALVYVPLHRTKYISRGYNQSLELAKGISRATSKPIAHGLKRQLASKSLTKLNRIQRIEQSSSLYYAELIPFKHVLLIDDVITSGATILSCCQAIRLVNPEIEISILSLAHAR